MQCLQGNTEAKVKKQAQEKEIVSLLMCVGLKWDPIRIVAIASPIYYKSLNHIFTIPRISINHSNILYSNMLQKIFLFPAEVCPT